MLFNQINPNEPQLFIESLENGALIAAIELYDTTGYAEMVDDLTGCGFRAAYIHARAETFGACFIYWYTWLVVYNPSINFNISPPTLPQFAPTVFDRIGELRNTATRASSDTADPQAYPIVTPDEARTMQGLPTGWTLADFARYAVEPPPADCRPMRRLAWFTSAGILPPDTLYIHPLHHRPLTSGEVAALVADTSVDWVRDQLTLAESGYWEGQDWESSYRADYAQWVGDATPGKAVKTFDLTEYIAKDTQDYSAICKRFPHYKFNVDLRGNLVRPWDEIRNRNRV